MKFSKARNGPFRRAGLEHRLWVQKVDLENRSNAVCRSYRSVERSVAEGRVDVLKATEVLDREDSGLFLRTMKDRESPVVSIYEKLPSIAYRNPEMRGLRRAYNAPWASSCLKITDEVPLYSPIRSRFDIGMEERERRIAKRRQREVVKRLSMASKVLTQEVLSPCTHYLTETSTPTISASDKKQWAGLLHLPYPKRTI